MRCCAFDPRDVPGRTPAESASCALDLEVPQVAWPRIRVEEASCAS